VNNASTVDYLPNNFVSYVGIWQHWKYPKRAIIGMQPWNVGPTGYSLMKYLYIYILMSDIHMYNPTIIPTPILA